MKTFIYALCEPGTRTVRYIGKARNPKKRLGEHVRTTSKTATHVGNWLRSLKEAPDMVVLREVEGDGSEAEMRYIRLARGLRLRLTNITDGGEAPMLGRRHSEKSRKAIGDSSRGRICPPFTTEHCAAISASKKGVRHTAEHRAKNSAANSGTNNAMFGKPAPNKGIRRAPETIEKMKRAARLRWSVLTDSERAERGTAMSEGWAKRKAAK